MTLWNGSRTVNPAAERGIERGFESGPGMGGLPRVGANPYASTAMSKKRILFVDDRPEHLRQPVLRLQLAGYEVEEAATGAEGLAALRGDEPFDLVILDAELPNEDGWDVLKEIRSDEDLRDLKVVVFMAPKGETGQLALVAVDAELRRPFNLATLLEAVERVIGKP